MTVIDWKRLVWDTEPHDAIEDSNNEDETGCYWAQFMKKILLEAKPNNETTFLTEMEKTMLDTNYLECPDCNDFYKKIIMSKNKRKEYFLEEGED